MHRRAESQPEKPSALDHEQMFNAIIGQTETFNTPFLRLIAMTVWLYGIFKLITQKSSLDLSLHPNPHRIFIIRAALT